ncbi:leucyl/phenylalanyl-tRNA--protein transferase [Aestuariirhabdus litorea]|uniref:Leucyl/phenylalanyl-tRNA--protein transferase n=1 Tax=Aestuariirhabdus litorea TaxID=2528527 RepID=A0A3P3VPT7_9GAMM|nr:leucyl/phenylalanyl-tRNA--protein transferase [Aestuariirhabdus litorea]RRJ84792.1 leucyl/phenylalanyl-tRNA--protein transferase [Aestuariirhabdus litorea]RWW98015.1 leucyl/phenylalanyl-tRNA--protein transferase [Endozoicomonadaceae bacterium GTF-13]
MPRLPWLDENLVQFPPPQQALDDPNGLLAAGGNLSPTTLLNAYSQGIFPWFSEGEPILWWSPAPRCVLFPGDLHISRSLHKTLRRHPYQLSMDRAFPTVMQECAGPRNYTDQTWINSQMQDAYSELHRQGYAHSVECWQQGELVGGLYGVAIDRVFFGESMFSRAPNASKIALVHLCGQLQKQGYQLIDCQVESPHLRSLGSTTMDRHSFCDLLDKFAKLPPAGAELSRPLPWKLDWNYDG